jgi:hypothetical protein
MVMAPTVYDFLFQFELQIAGLSWRLWERSISQR